MKKIYWFKREREIRYSTKNICKNKFDSRNALGRGGGACLKYTFKTPFTKINTDMVYVVLL